MKFSLQNLKGMRGTIETKREKFGKNAMREVSV